MNVIDKNGFIICSCYSCIHNKKDIHRCKIHDKNCNICAKEKKEWLPDSPPERYITIKGILYKKGSHTWSYAGYEPNRIIQKAIESVNFIKDDEFMI